MTGVLKQEHDRQQLWHDRELPDPVAVVTEERMTERKTGQPFTSPKRQQLDQHFETNPQDRPPWW